LEVNRLGICKRVKILVDTNFLMQLVEGVYAPSLIAEAVDYSYELVIPESVILELKQLSREAPLASTRRLALRTLNLLEMNKIPHKIATSLADNADDDLIALAKFIRTSGCRVVIATNDRELRRRARELGVPCLYYRENKGVLEVDWL
jgi:rRNA-processing protein FCF1